MYSFSRNYNDENYKYLDDGEIIGFLKKSFRDGANSIGVCGRL